MRAVRQRIGQPAPAHGSLLGANPHLPTSAVSWRHGVTLESKPKAMGSTVVAVRSPSR
jgi:hypothetical protein